MKKTPLEIERKKYQPTRPNFLKNLQEIEIKEVTQTSHSTMQPLFPHTYNQKKVKFVKGSKRESNPLRVGVVLSGGQAAGGHNVIGALFDGIKEIHPDSQLIGFLGGPSGIIEGQTKEITQALVFEYRNTGGFDMIGSGRTKIETQEQLNDALKNVQSLKLDGLVIIGGDDSNTNAAILAEFFKSKNCATTVVGVPKTIDGDLKNDDVEISFGFDTACKTYAELIGNIARDALSAKKYYHFIKLMGRSASHVALECALQTQVNLTFLGEEVAERQMTLQEITNEITDLIVARSEKGKDYGLILIPEGLIEFIPEVKALIAEVNTHLVQGNEDVLGRLSEESRKTFELFPERLQEQLLLDRDPHGNVQVSHIATEELLIHTVKRELKKRKNYQGKFSPVNHFFGYEGRSAFPSNFDATYCNALGLVAALLIRFQLSGYMSAISHLTKPSVDWEGMGIPLVSMIHMEERKGKQKPVISKALVSMEGPPFHAFNEARESWKFHDDYLFPGPIQFFGPSHLTDPPVKTLQIEREARVPSRV